MKSQRHFFAQRPADKLLTHNPPEPGASSFADRLAGRAVRPASPDAHTADPLLRRALALRYQVYCLECSFLSPDDYPEGVETDEHDETAKHFYAFDANEELVGYVRLVRPDAAHRFPFQRHCTTSVEGFGLPQAGASAEISRLMIRHDYRRLRTGQSAREGALQDLAHPPGPHRQDAPQVLLTLYRQMYAYSRQVGINHWYAAMERALARSLMRLNIGFRPIGPQVNYYGQVAPYLASLNELEAQLHARDPALLAWLQQAPYPNTNMAPVGSRLSQGWHPVSLNIELKKTTAP
jgi:N-acyl amino acid synthase of PEP-CTERM/exosortase system